MRADKFIGMFGLALLLLAYNAIPARAEEPGYRIVDNVLIYLGVVPAPMILKEYPKGDEERLMHGGVPSEQGHYHIMIALFDVKTSERISNAQVTASTSEFGMAREAKNLQPMDVADATTFGNYFQFKTGTFSIDVSIHIPGRAKEIKVRFEYSSQ
jgi:hypothetical protein